MSLKDAVFFCNMIISKEWEILWQFRWSWKNHCCIFHRIVQSCPVHPEYTIIILWTRVIFSPKVILSIEQCLGTLVVPPTCLVNNGTVVRVRKVMCSKSHSTVIGQVVGDISCIRITDIHRIVLCTVRYLEVTIRDSPLF